MAGEAKYLYAEGLQPYNKPAVLQVVDGGPQHALHPHLQQILPHFEPSQGPPKPSSSLSLVSCVPPRSVYLVIRDGT